MLDLCTEWNGALVVQLQHPAKYKQSAASRQTSRTVAGCARQSRLENVYVEGVPIPTRFAFSLSHVSAGEKTCRRAEPAE
jgi:hypothetical protein